MVKAIPEGYHTVTPMFTFKDAKKAIEFYKKAFDATEKFVMPGPNGKGVMHAEINIGNSIIMMGDEHPEHDCKSAETLKGSPIHMYLYVQDADKAFNKAVQAGAVVKMEVQEMFWGDRMGIVIDPFGYCWSLATHVKELAPQEIKKSAEEFYDAQRASKM